MTAPEFDVSDVPLRYELASETQVTQRIVERNAKRIVQTRDSLESVDFCDDMLKTLDPIARVLVLAAVSDLRCAEARLEEVLERLRGDVRAESADPYPAGSAGRHEHLPEGDTP